MRTLTTSDGYRIHLDSYYQKPTYSGYLCGYPDTQKWIDYLFKDLSLIWGKRKIYIDPKWSTMSRLPSVMCAAWIDCDKIIPSTGSEMCGSHAFIIWFQDQDDIHPFDSLRDELIKIKWADIAINFDI